LAYNIAKGELPLPFTESEVKMRVVEPNGGGGPLGTRGLALHSDYAIHGTNDPSSIGKSVSMGCVLKSYSPMYLSEPHSVFKQANLSLRYLRKAYLS